MPDIIKENSNELVVVSPLETSLVITEDAEFRVVEVIDRGVQGEQGIQGNPPEHRWLGTALAFKNADGSWGDSINLIGPPLEVTIALVTTKPIQIQDNIAILPSLPYGDVVWNTAQVFTDLTVDDFNSEGNLLNNRDYLVESHLVKTLGNQVVFSSSMSTGLYAVVSYLAGQRL